MTWRSVIITTPAQLRHKNGALVVRQNGNDISVPLEDIATVIIDCPQITLTSQLLAAFASQKIAVITVDETHTPNGVLLSYLPHSRALQVMRKQMNLTQPHKKRLWQHIIQQKLINQSSVLQQHNHSIQANILIQLSNEVRSGDPDNLEGQGAQVYFRALFTPTFHRAQSRFYNASLNYGYSIIRSAFARSLVSHGFLTAFGIHHHSEQNAFNLADDLIEPYRAILDAHVLKCYPVEPKHELRPEDKAKIVSILHQDISRIEKGELSGRSTVLSLIDSTVISFRQRVDDGNIHLILPNLDIS